GGTSNRARSIRANFDATTAEMSDYERITSKHNPDANIPRLQQIANILSGLGAQFADLLGVTLPEYQLWVRNNIGSTSGSNFYERLAISGYGQFRTTKLTDIAGLSTWFMETMTKAAIKQTPKNVDNILKGIDWGNVQSGFTQLTQALADAGLLPAFADGGIHMGGLALVGERGPELVNFASPARIYSAPDTNRILAGNDNSE